MFWETKLSELQKLAPAGVIRDDAAACWIARLNAAINEPWHQHSAVVAQGDTRAAAVCNLWTHITNGGAQFTLHTSDGIKMFKWNARWIEIEIPQPIQADAPVLDEITVGSFDSSD